MELEALVDQTLSRGFPLSEDSMQALVQLFPPSVVAIALESGLSKGVVCITSTPSGRVAHEFSFCGTRTTLVLLPKRLYCSCESFVEMLVNSTSVTESFMCKHLLAAKIAIAANAVVHEKVKDADFSNRILNA